MILGFALGQGQMSNESVYTIWCASVKFSGPVNIYEIFLKQLNSNGSTFENKGQVEEAEKKRDFPHSIANV